MQLLQCLKQRDHHLVPDTGFTQRAAAEHAAQVRLLTVLHHDVQGGPIVQRCPKRHNMLIGELLMDLVLLNNLQEQVIMCPASRS